MKIAVFDTHRFDREALAEANKSFEHRLSFFEPRLTKETDALAAEFPCVCPFANDLLDAPCLAACQLSVNLDLAS